ncbi:hypothetical protein NQZ68_005756 [Dissostichus eleginoides]|nr:hypothetical protein NQZ68_005756 [Dissostichus eleginoides]
MMLIGGQIETLPEDETGRTFTSPGPRGAPQRGFTSAPPPLSRHTQQSETPREGRSLLSAHRPRHRHVLSDMLFYGQPNFGGYTKLHDLFNPHL